MPSRRSLNDLFSRARSEQSPLTEQTIRNIVSNSHPQRSAMMSPAFLITTGLAVAAATSVFVITNISDTNSPAKVVSASSVPASTDMKGAYGVDSRSNGDTHSGEGSAPSQQMNSGDRQHIVLRDKPSKVGNHAPNTCVEDVLVSTDKVAFHLAALQADEELFKSLSIEPHAVDAICRNLAGADSVTNCSADGRDATVKVCLFKEGELNEVQFMDRPGPLPVMFTSANGKGRVVTSRFTTNVDPNKLIPVAANGCGSDVLMWFTPTEEFVYSLPDSLGDELEHNLDIVVHVDSIQSWFRINSTSSVYDTTNPDARVISKRFDLKLDGPLKEILKLKDEYNPMFKMDIEHLDSTMKSMNFQWQSLSDSLLDSLNIDMRIDFDSLKSRMRMMIKSPNSTSIIDRALPLNDVIEMQEDQANVLAPSRQLSVRTMKRIVVVHCGSRSTAASLPAPVRLQETRSTDGALKATTVYPNPTSDGGVTLRYSLVEPRLLTVTLLDLNGSVVRELVSNQWRQSGEGQMAFTLNGVPAGMYLLAIATDAGERAIQRLIVQ